MAGFMRNGAAAVVALVACAGAANACGRVVSTTYYYGPMCYPVVYASPIWICPPMLTPVPYTPAVIPLVPSARPVPAPPSKDPKDPGQTKEPPIDSKALRPIISESRSAGLKSESAKEKAKVGFWNVTGRDVQLKIDGETRVLQRDRAITLELGRSFVMQVDHQEPSSEQVPAGENFHEVVIRK